MGAIFTRLPIFPVNRGKFQQSPKSFLIDNFCFIVNLVGMQRCNRLTIEIEPEQHRQIKTLATFSGMTIKEYILTKILGPQQKTGSDANAELTKSAANSRRLRKAVAAPKSKHVTFTSMKELKDALGI
jgi:hypothetical protein